MSEGRHKSCKFERLHRDLPIFVLKTEADCLLYAVGTVAPLSAGDVELVRRYWASSNELPERLVDFVRNVEHSAEQAQRQWTAQASIPFQPTNLIVHLGNACNLTCDYCYSAHRDSTGRRRKEEQTVSLQAVSAAAELVAKNCYEQDLPLQVAIHGGGEPTVFAEQMEVCVREVRRIAVSRNVRCESYLATNGQMSQSEARRVATLFDRVGLSCDGPSDLQDQQRSRQDDRRSSEVLLQTAEALAECGTAVEVRATITPHSVDRLPDIVAYACHQLHAKTVRLEPRFGNDGWEREHIQVFVEGLSLARNVSRSCDAECIYAGLRPTEIHGPYCDVSRQVLRLLPNGVVSTCFLGDSAGLGSSVSAEVGRYDATQDNVILNADRIVWFQEQQAAIPDECNKCPAILHCVRGCPTWCPASGEQLDSDSFRCRLHRELLINWLVECMQANDLKAGA